MSGPYSHSREFMIARQEKKLNRNGIEYHKNCGGGSDGDVYVGELPADITSPASRVDRDERHAILRCALAAMPENDRAILVMRHFDGMGNAECAAALGLTEKAASIRYVRALERLQQKLVEVSCFRKN